MDSTVDTPMRIQEVRLIGDDVHLSLQLRVDGPKRFPSDLLFGQLTGELCFDQWGFKHQTTRGKGATRMDQVESISFLKDKDLYELRAQVRSLDQDADGPIVRRIATTDSGETVRMIMDALRRIGFNVKREVNRQK